MKIELTTEHFIEAVQTAVRFVERRPNLPVLASILLIAENNTLTLRATNLEHGTEIVIAATVLEGGQVAVPGSVLTGFLANARSKTVKLVTDGSVLKVSAERAVATIKTVSTEDFPTLPRVTSDQSFKVSGTDIARAIRSVSNCVAVSTVKPELQSVLVYGEAGKLYAVATDSFRLSEKSVALPGGGDIPHILIPARTVGDFTRLVELSKGEVEVLFNENQLSVQVGNIYYTTRLQDGTFPNYRQIVPKAFTTEVVALRDDLSSAVKSLAIFSDKFMQVILSVKPEEKVVTLTSRNPEVGEQISEVRVTVEGEPITLSFNSRYVQDGFQAVPSESVRLWFNGAGRAMLIRDAADDSFFYLAMPMNR